MTSPMAWAIHFHSKSVDVESQVALAVPSVAKFIPMMRVAEREVAEGAAVDLAHFGGRSEAICCLDLDGHDDDELKTHESRNTSRCRQSQLYQLEYRYRTSDPIFRSSNSLTPALRECPPGGILSESRRRRLVFSDL